MPIFDVTSAQVLLAVVDAAALGAWLAVAVVIEDSFPRAASIMRNMAEPLLPAATLILTVLCCVKLELVGSAIISATLRPTPDVQNTLRGIIYMAVVQLVVAPMGFNLIFLGLGKAVLSLIERRRIVAAEPVGPAVGAGLLLVAAICGYAAFAASLTIILP